jgi:hypothetical protein
MIRHFIFIKVLFTLVLYSSPAVAQQLSMLVKAENSLNRISKQIRDAGSDTLRIELNQEFTETLNNALLQPGSFDYPFDSLRNLGKLKSPDEKFRIFNWNLPKSDGTNSCFGIVQLYDKGRKQSTCIVLDDISDTLQVPEKVRLTKGEWYGSLYYKMIKNEAGGKEFYTMLGWKNLNPLVSLKVIDVLSFDEAGNPCFGAGMFRNWEDGKCQRIIFRYSASATMVLKYDDQSLPPGLKLSPGSKPTGKESKKVKMIVCDRLLPMDPALEHIYQYYVPQTDVCDGFLFQNGAWMFIRDIDARNLPEPSGKKR